MVGDSPPTWGGLAAKINVAAIRTGKTDPGTFPEVVMHQIPISRTSPILPRR